MRLKDAAADEIVGSWSRSDINALAFFALATASLDKEVAELFPKTSVFDFSGGGGLGGLFLLTWVALLADVYEYKSLL